MREQVEGGPVDVLTGDYLAELTMAILARQRMKDPAAGYARVFLDQMEEVLGTCLERGIKVVANAGGLNPAGLARALEELAARLGLEATVATVAGDDLMGRLEELAADGVALRHPTRSVRPLTANAYLGGWGIATALGRGADVVVTGRVSDASLTVGPAAWWHGWERDAWDRLAGAVVAGHVIECGAQATGGNFPFFAEIPGLEDPGFPIAEVAADGSAIITKHPGTGGAVTRGTVTAQLLYEIAGPAYLNPDVVARLDTVRVDDLGGDRVRLSGVRGEPAPETTKTAMVGVEGYRNEVTFVIPGLDVDAKARLVEEALWRRLGGPERFTRVERRLVRSAAVDPGCNEAAFGFLTIAVIDPDAARVGRAFSNAAVELALANYPGFSLTSPPRGERPAIVYWSSLVPTRQVPAVVTVRGETVRVPGEVATGPWTARPSPRPPEPVPFGGRRRRVPLGRVAGARSGDKGGDANLGVWVRDEEAFAWLVGFLTVDRLRDLLPETRELPIDRHVLPNLRAMNFLLRGFLGEGVASSLRADPQAKTLGEYLRAKIVEVPERLLGKVSRPGSAP